MTPMLSTASVDKNTMKGTHSFLVTRSLGLPRFETLSHLLISLLDNYSLFTASRFMICCDSCQEWFHGSCVGISATQGRIMENGGHEYICPPCTVKKQSQVQAEPHPQPQPELSFPECFTQSPSGDERKGHEEQQALKVRIAFGLPFLRYNKYLSNSAFSPVFLYI